MSTKNPSKSARSTAAGMMASVSKMAKEQLAGLVKRQRNMRMHTKYKTLDQKQDDKNVQIKARIKDLNYRTQIEKEYKDSMRRANKGSSSDAPGRQVKAGGKP